MYIPDILLLDEATSALDADNTKKAEEAIFGLAKDEVFLSCGLHIATIKACLTLTDVLILWTARSIKIKRGR